MLADTAMPGAKDDLLGLKENIIIGHLIPGRQRDLPVLGDRHRAAAGIRAAAAPGGGGRAEPVPGGLGGDGGEAGGRVGRRTGLVPVPITSRPERCRVLAGSCRVWDCTRRSACVPSVATSPLFLPGRRFGATHEVASQSLNGLRVGIPACCHGGRRPSRRAGGPRAWRLAAG